MARGTAAGCCTIIGEQGQRKADYTQKRNTIYGTFVVTNGDNAPVRLDRGFIKAHVNYLRKSKLSEEQCVETMKKTVENKVNWVSEKVHNQFFEDVVAEFRGIR